MNCRNHRLALCLVHLLKQYKDLQLTACTNRSLELDSDNAEEVIKKFFLLFGG